jgi:ABC-type uncharacterized transport system substrate-binding protein
MSMLLTELSVKELKILEETLPEATRFDVLWNPSTPSHPTAVRAVKSAGGVLGLQLVFVPAESVSDIGESFSTLARERASGALVLSSPLYSSQAGLLAELQTKYRVPAIFANRTNVDAGGLASYGADLADLYRRSASYIAKIFKGAAPSDLPVEQAAKYLMVLNLKRANVVDTSLPRRVQSCWYPAIKYCACAS